MSPLHTPKPTDAALLASAPALHAAASELLGSLLLVLPPDGLVPGAGGQLGAGRLPVLRLRCSPRHGRPCPAWCRQCRPRPGQCLAAGGVLLVLPPGGPVPGAGGRLGASRLPVLRLRCSPHRWPTLAGLVPAVPSSPRSVPSGPRCAARPSSWRAGPGAGGQLGAGRLPVLRRGGAER